MLEGKIGEYIDKAIAVGVEWSPRVLGALLGLVVGLIVIRIVANGAERALRRAKIDETLRPFLVSLMQWILKAALGVALLTTVGIQAASFVAVLGAAGLAIGLALQGSLSNLAGGALLLIFHPFKVGDLIEAGGVTGVVKEIQIFATILVTPSGKRVILPNGGLAGNKVTNLSAEGTLRVEVSVGIAYGADIKAARDVLLKAMSSFAGVLEDPGPSVHVAELGDSSVNLAARSWCAAEDYWDVFFGLNEACKVALDEAGISIPFPQREVRMLNKVA